jgi:hypothetical protein
VRPVAGEGDDSLEERSAAQVVRASGRAATNRSAVVTRRWTAEASRAMASWSVAAAAAESMTARSIRVRGGTAFGCRSASSKRRERITTTPGRWTTLRFTGMVMCTVFGVSLPRSAHHQALRWLTTAPAPAYSQAAQIRCSASREPFQVP